MAAVALLKFRDALNTGANGEAFFSAYGQDVIIENSDNTDVQSWRIWLLYAPPGSAREIRSGVDPFVLLNGSPTSTTPAVTLTNLEAGFPGCYRIMLEVFDAPNYGGARDVDIRNIGILTPRRNLIVPPYQVLPLSLPVPGSGDPSAKPNELNFGGQTYGWSGSLNPAAKGMNDALLALDALDLELVKVSAVDSTADYLINKLASNYGLTLAPVDLGGGNLAVRFGILQSVSNHTLAAGDNFDVNPTAWASLYVCRLSSPADAAIGGFQATAQVDDVLIKRVFNVGSFSVTLKNEDLGSAIVNRLITPGGTDLVLSPDEGVDLFYDRTTERWRVGEVGSSGGGTPVQYAVAATLNQTVFPLPSTPLADVVLMSVSGIVQNPADYTVVGPILTYSGISLAAGTPVSFYYWTGSGGGGGGGTDELVKVSAADTTAGYLDAKLLPGEGLRKTITSPGAAEGLQLDLPDKVGQLAESALAMDAVADGYFANAFGFDGTYTWVGFREYNEHLGKWVRFNKALNYVERHEYTAGAYSTVAALVFDEARSRMLEVLVYDSGGGSYVAEIITHTLATPSVAGTPVSLGAASGGAQSITVLPAGDYIFVFGLPGGTKRLLATDLTVQVGSGITGAPHRMFYDPTDRYGDGEGRVYTQPALHVYARWIPSTGANDAFYQPEGEFNSTVPIGIDPVGGRMWAVWEKGTSRNHLGSWDLHTFGGNLRFIAPAGEIGEPDLPHDWMFGGIVDGTAAYSIAQQGAGSYCYYIQKFTDSGAAIVEGSQVSDGATSLDAYDPQYLFLNVFNAFRVSLKAGSKMLTLVQSYSSRAWCVRALELSPMADALEDFEATEIDWAPVARVGGDLSGRGDNPKVTGIVGRNLNAISGSVPGEQMLMPANSGQSIIFSFTPYTTRVGGHANPTETVGYPFTGFDVLRTNDADPLTLQINETAYTHPRTLHIRDIKGNAGQLGSHITVEPYGTEEVKFADAGFVSSFVLRSAYEEVVLATVPGTAPFIGAWQVAERHRFWEKIEVTVDSTVIDSGYALCLVDTSAAPLTVILSGTPQHDDWCIVKDETGDAGTNPITVHGNGYYIDQGTTCTIAAPYGFVKLRYDAPSFTWVIVSERASAGVASDELVKVSSDDTGAGYLETKFIPGFGLEAEVLNPAGAESLEVGLEPTSGDTKSLTTNSILGSLSLTWDGTHLWGIPKSTLNGTGYLRFSPTDGSFLEEVPNYPDGYVTQDLVYESTLDRVVAVRVDNGTNAHYLEAFSKAIPSVKTTGTSIFNPYFTLVKMIAGGGYIWLHLEDGDDGFIYRVPADLSTSTVAATLATDFDLLAFDNNTTRYGDGEGRLFYSVSNTTIGRLKPSTLATDATFSPISGTGEILCMYVHEAIGRIWCAWVDDGDYYIGVFDCNTLGANLRSAIAVSNTMFNFVLTTYYGVVALCSGMPTQMVRLTDTGAVIDQYTLGYAYCETQPPAPGLRLAVYTDGHTLFPVYDYATSRSLVKCWRGITEDHSPVEVVWEERQDQLIKVDQYDGIGGYLSDKLVAGSVSITTLTPANGMRQLQLNLNQSLASLSPLASGDNDDVSPTDWAFASVLRATSAAAAGITGLAAVTAGDVLLKKLYNVGSYNITLKHQNAGSSAENRLIIPGGADLVLAPDDVVDLFYDVTSQRWRIG